MVEAVDDSLTCDIVRNTLGAELRDLSSNPDFGTPGKPRFPFFHVPLLRAVKTKLRAETTTSPVLDSGTRDSGTSPLPENLRLRLR